MAFALATIARAASFRNENRQDYKGVNALIGRCWGHVQHTEAEMKHHLSFYSQSVVLIQDAVLSAVIFGRYLIGARLHEVVHCMSNALREYWLTASYVAGLGLVGAATVLAATVLFQIPTW